MQLRMLTGPRRLFAAGLFVLAALSLHAEKVRPLSEAESAATQTAAAYLSRGAEAVYEQLASASPLMKLRKEEALAEIESRLGPPAGATWELQTVVPALKDNTAAFNVSFPSGLDDTLVFEMTGDNKIANIRTLAEPSPIPPPFPPEPTRAAVDPEAPSGPSRLPLFLGVVAALTAGAAAFVYRPNAAAAKGMMAAGVCGLLIAGFVGLRNDPRLDASPSPEVLAAASKNAYPRIGSLLPLRRILAAGVGDLDAVYKQVAVGGFAKEVATLWKAQYDLQQMKISDVERALHGFPSPSSVPLAEILRGREAFYQAKEAEAVMAYERAINLGPGRDGLWIETAQALETLGFDERAQGYLDRLVRIGSRDANVYYSAAVLAAAHDRADDAENTLQQAWLLRPVERSALVRTGMLWSTLRRPRIMSQIRLNLPAEATFASAAVASRPITLPFDAESRVSGDFFDVKIGAQELEVPGGACLAPRGTPVVDAGLWARSEQEKGLQDFAQLVPLARTGGAYAQPQLRRRLVRCATALATYNRWKDVLQLTEGVDPKAEHVPADIFFLRDVALQRTERIPEAKLLLGQFAQSPVLKRKNNQQLYAQIGLMLSLLDEYDAAIKLLDRAGNARQAAFVDREVTKIQMNKRLATKYNTYASPHFIIHYPDDVSQDFAKRLGDVMEAELARLQKWVPTPNFRPTVVNMLWYRDFRDSYTGNDYILGFYQGKITVPLAGIPDFIPPAVALLTHELTHAMLAQATNEQAPSWFQEGLAQRTEMVPFKANAFNMYDDDKLLSVSVLDAVLHGSPDPEMIGEAYIVAQTIIRYIESAYGKAGLAKMIAAYRDGTTTDEAIRRLSGLSVAEFDTRLRAWGRAGSKTFENHEIVSYEAKPESDEIHWTRRPGGQP